MIDALKELFKQPYWVIALILGAALVGMPCVTVDKDYRLATHPPNTLLLAAIGGALLILSAAGFAFTLWSKRASDEHNPALGLDLTRVREADGAMWTTVGGCEIRVVEGRVQDFIPELGSAIALPCNEYFDDRCVGDTKSALGAYVNRVFEGQVDAFISFVDQSKRELGAGILQQKTDGEQSESFGAGRCLLLLKPLGRSLAIALVSTTTQRAGQGLSARISYLFDGMRELVTRLADARLNEVVMPVLGAGHGRIDTSLAFVGLLLAIAEGAQYGQGGQRLRRVTVVVFKRDANTPAHVDRQIVRRALALVGVQG
jgi:hypothetical protein